MGKDRAVENQTETLLICRWVRGEIILSSLHSRKSFVYFLLRAPNVWNLASKGWSSAGSSILNRKTINFYL